MVENDYTLTTFPYYIVRFKPIGMWQENSRGESFHTTQYDLNEALSEEIAEGEGKFPYYIVRFKPPTRVEIFKTGILFPYYIVRFKLQSQIHRLSEVSSFHTTQYDLNFICEMFIYFEHMFPYYIVRFKLKEDTTFRISAIGFPYYIVRFKLHLRSDVHIL